ncbi:MAG TPA: hypothetical protein PKA64_16660, partial [Myxococcota bacterium]|nr:hypothetical protein [Myxococcota bacterium]
IAWLAGGAVEAWGRRLDAGVDLRLVAAVRRDASQTDGSYRSKLKVERWLIPVCEARWRGP